MKTKADLKKALKTAMQHYDELRNARNRYPEGSQEWKTWDALVYEAGLAVYRLTTKINK